MHSNQVEYLRAIARSLIRNNNLSTPFLLIDEGEVRESVNLLRNFLPQAKFFYAAKANSAPQLIELLRSLGLCLDVSSAAEIVQARELGVSGEDLFLSSPFKTTETLKALFEHNVAAVSLDSLQEVERIATLHATPLAKHTPKIFTRIRLESTDVAINLNTKFGCSPTEALEIIKRVDDLGLEVGGICFHVGTQSTNSHNHVLGIRAAMLIAQKAYESLGIRVPVIDIGGGFCDPITAAKRGIDLHNYYKTIQDACNEASAAGFEIYAEPGRALVSSAGTVVTSVLGTNIRGGQRWAYLDDGVYGCYSIKLYEHPPFEFYTLKMREDDYCLDQAHATWTIAGPSCCSCDIIAGDIELPDNLAAGDILLTPNMGAYTTATACNFNGIPIPETHVVRTNSTNHRFTTAILNNKLPLDQQQHYAIPPRRKDRKRPFAKKLLQTRYFC